MLSESAVFPIITT